MEDLFKVAGRKLSIDKKGNWYIVYLDNKEYSRTMAWETAINSVKNLAAGIIAEAADFVLANKKY